MILAIGAAEAFLFSCDDDEKSVTEPVVTTSLVTEITTTSAKGGGTISNDGNSSIIASGLVYSSAIALPTVNDDKTEVSATSGSFTSVMEDLSSGTTYHVRAYATNSVGTAYGAVVDFTTGNLAPTVSDVSFTGDMEVNKELAATYIYNDAEADEEDGTTFQWYSASDGAGTGEMAIEGATEMTYRIGEALQGKYIRVGVTPKSSSGATTGEETKSIFKGAVGEATTVTFMYNGQEVTYGIKISQKTGEKWLDRNLGAPNKPTSFDDYTNYGDLFQWGRLADGHQIVLRNGPNDTDMSGVNGTTSLIEPFEYSDSDNPGHVKFIVFNSGEQPFDWRKPQNNNLWQGVNGTNNPCPTGWRIPTQAEWAAEEMTSISDAFNKLGITRTSLRYGADATFLFSQNGYYWSSTIGSDSNGDPKFVIRIRFNDDSYVEVSTFRGSGYGCRCIKD